MASDYSVEPTRTKHEEPNVTVVETLGMVFSSRLIKARPTEINALCHLQDLTRTLTSVPSPARQALSPTTRNRDPVPPADPIPSLSQGPPLAQLARQAQLRTQQKRAVHPLRLPEFHAQGEMSHSVPEVMPHVRCRETGKW